MSLTNKNVHQRFYQDLPNFPEVWHNWKSGFTYQSGIYQQREKTSKSPIPPWISHVPRICFLFFWGGWADIRYCTSSCNISLTNNDNWQTHSLKVKLSNSNLHSETTDFQNLKVPAQLPPMSSQLHELLVFTPHMLRHHHLIFGSFFQDSFGNVKKHSQRISMDPGRVYKKTLAAVWRLLSFPGVDWVNGYRWRNQVHSINQPWG